MSVVARGDRFDAPAIYRGRDRRARSSGLIAPLVARRVLPMACLVGLGVALPALALVQRVFEAAVLARYVGVATGLLFVVAGATALVTWRVAGRALHGWLGSSLIVLGVVTLLADGLIIHAHGTADPEQSADATIGAALAVGLLLRGMTGNEVDSGLSPLVVLSVTLGSAMLGMGLLSVTRATGADPGWATGVATVAALRSGSLVAWLVATAAAVRKASRHRDVVPWIGAVVSLLGLSSAARLATALQPSPPARWASLLLLLAGAALAAGAGVTRVQAVLRAGNRRELRLHRDLDATRRRAWSDQARWEELLHDVRNAVLGLQAADAVLHSQSTRELVDNEELAESISAELARLHALVGPRRVLAPVDVELPGLIHPIVGAERALGAEVESRVDALTVRADPEALGRVLQNLLENARRHAPGSAVVVAATRAGGHAAITVRDGGAGIPPPTREAVFERGARRHGGTGSGIGLFVSRSLVTAMGGTIEVVADDRPGCGIVVTLPLTPSATLASGPDRGRPVPLRQSVGA